MRRPSLPSLVGYPLVLLVACGTSFSASGPDSGGSTDAAAGQDSEAASEGGGQEAGGTETGGSEGGGAETGSVEAGGGDTGPSVEGGGPGTYCGPALVCTGTGGQQGTVCCVAKVAPMYQCAGSDCGCDTQLDCSSDADCQGNQCCIDTQKVDGGCSTGHFVATCRVACLTAAHMCDPAKQPSQCRTNQSCSPDASSVGLPAGSGFGICN